MNKKIKNDPIFMHKLATVLGVVIGLVVGGLVAREADKYTEPLDRSEEQDNEHKRAVR